MLLVLRCILITLSPTFSGRSQITGTTPPRAHCDLRHVPGSDYRSRLEFHRLLIQYRQQPFQPRLETQGVQESKTNRCYPYRLSWDSDLDNPRNLLALHFTIDTEPERTNARKDTLSFLETVEEVVQAKQNLAPRCNAAPA